MGIKHGQGAVHTEYQNISPNHPSLPGRQTFTEAASGCLAWQRWAWLLAVGCKTCSSFLEEYQFPPHFLRPTVSLFSSKCEK